MTSTRTAATTLAVTLGLAAASWVLAVREMHGMDMGSETRLGSLAFFVGIWVPMTAAMMLPGAVPAALASLRFGRRPLAAPAFAGSYLAVWTMIGLAVYALYEPHGAVVAGALTAAAGLYELTPLKRECRRRCLEPIRSGAVFGAWCVGSSIGLMVVLLALGPMSLAWMSLIAVVALAQKLVPPTAFVDVPLAVALVALGIAVAVE